MSDFLFLAQVTEPAGTSSEAELVPSLICLGILLPFWLLSIWYWHRYYYVRRGGLAGVLGGLFAGIFTGLGIMAMMLSFIGRTVSNRHDEIGPCPLCSKRKLLPHTIQPRCPHCKQDVLGTQYLTPDEWRQSGF